MAGVTFVDEVREVLLVGVVAIDRLGLQLRQLRSRRLVLPLLHEGPGQLGRHDLRRSN